MLPHLGRLVLITTYNKYLDLNTYPVLLHSIGKKIMVIDFDDTLCFVIRCQLILKLFYNNVRGDGKRAPCIHTYAYTVVNVSNRIAQ